MQRQRIGQIFQRRRFAASLADDINLKTLGDKPFALPPDACGVFFFLLMIIEPLSLIERVSRI
jgi:hypothetical protein